MRKYIYLFLSIVAGLFLYFASNFFQGAPGQQNYARAKINLDNLVYFDHRITLYCDAKYDENKNINLPNGFYSPVHQKRMMKMEWEHAVPAENFGRAFKEWREGDPACVKNGKPYRGRKCAEKMNGEFRRMEGDMYNLFPAIGAVNAARGNRQYADLPHTPVSFGSCAVKISGNLFEPPESAKGRVARATLYMASRYPQFKLSAKQKKLFEAWNNLYQVDRWECLRAKRIEKIQGNENSFVKKPCKNAGMW